MARTDLVLQTEDHARFGAALDRLIKAANGSFVLLLSQSGRQVATAGSLGGADATTMASLAAGNIVSPLQQITDEDIESLFG